MRAETRHSLVLMLGTGLTALFSAIYAVVAGRVLGTAGYAEFTVANAVIFFCGTMMAPINETAARYSAFISVRNPPGNLRALARTFHRRVAIAGALLLIGGLMVLKPMAAALNLTSSYPLLIAYGVVFLTLFVSVARGILRGAHRFADFNANTVCEASVRLLIGLPLLVLWASPTAALAGSLAAMVTAVALSEIQLRRLWADHPDQAVIGFSIKDFAIPVLIFSLLRAGFEHVDMFLVKHYLSAHQAGVYAAAIPLSRLVGLAATPFGTLIIPMMTALHLSGRPTIHTLSRLCGNFVCLVAGPLIVATLWAEPIIKLLYGEAFLETAPIVAPLMAGRAAHYLAAMLGLFFMAVGQYRILGIYALGLVVEIVALMFQHDSPETVVRVVAWSQAAVLGAMVILVFLPRPRPSQSGPGPNQYGPL